MGICNNKSR